MEFVQKIVMEIGTSKMWKMIAALIKIHKKWKLYKKIYKSILKICCKRKWYFSSHFTLEHSLENKIQEGPLVEIVHFPFLFLKLKVKL